jgi:uncharacterized protein Veg
MQHLCSIRQAIATNVGHDVELTCRNRRKESVRRGVIEGAYGSLFTVIVCVDGQQRRLSYTYCDILTKSVIVRPLQNCSGRTSSSQ